MNRAVQEGGLARRDVRWSDEPCTLDDRPWRLPSVGLVALAGDAVIEPELRAFLGSDAELHTTRVSITSDIRDLADHGQELAAASRLLLPGGRLDVVAIGCTSAAVVIGSQGLQAAIRAARPGVGTTDPVAASVAEFRERRVRSVAILTPYVRSLNERLAATLEAHGVDVVAGGSFRAENVGRVLARTPANFISSASILQAVLKLGASKADGVFVSCTGLRCAAILPEAERILGKPVITSNQAVAAHALRLSRGLGPSP
jgi:maleate isomerase